VPAGGIGFFTVEYDSKTDLSIRVRTDTELKIENDELSLKYLPDYESEGVYFEMTDKLSDDSKVVGFDIRYWQSYQSFG